MKKLVLASIATTMLSSTAALAQPQKGSWMAGADLLGASAGFNQSSPGNKYVDFIITPKVGYFISNRMVVGSSFTLGGAIVPGRFSNLVGGVTPFARYYFFPKDGAKTRRLYFFAEAHAGVITAWAKDKINDVTYTSSSMTAGFGPGVAYFLTPNISIESAFKVNYSRSLDKNYLPQHGITPNLTIGFQIYLGGKKKADDAAK